MIMKLHLLVPVVLCSTAQNFSEGDYVDMDESGERLRTESMEELESIFSGVNLERGHEICLSEPRHRDDNFELSPLSFDDVDELVSVVSQRVVAENFLMFPRAFDRGEASMYLGEIAQLCLDPNNMKTWAIRCLDGRFIGQILYTAAHGDITHRPHPPSVLNSYILNFFLSEAYANEGIATRALSITLRFVLTVISPYKQVSAYIFKDNQEGIKILKENNFVLNPHFTEMITRNDKIRELLIYTFNVTEGFPVHRKLPPAVLDYFL